MRVQCVVFVAGLVACGDDGAQQPSTSLSLVTSPRRVIADGRTQATVHVTAVDRDGNALVGREVSLEAVPGVVLEQTSGVTDKTGVFSARFTASGPATATLTATSGDGRIEASLQLIPVPAACGSVELARMPIASESWYPFAAGDIDDDGRAELATLQYDFATGSKLLVRRGTAGGLEPQASRTIALEAEATAVQMGDLDRDGILDLVAARVALDSEIAIQLASGDTLTTAAAWSASSLLVRDVDGDHKVDLLAFPSSMNLPNPIELLRGRGDGTFEKGRPLGHAGGIEGLAAGDFNRDGILDLVTVGYPTGPTGFTGRAVSYLQGTADGTFARRVTVTGSEATSDPMSIAAGDLDNDGSLDFVTASSFMSNQLRTYRGNGTGTFAAPLSVDPGIGANTIELADMNRDGNLDLITGSGSAIAILLGRGDQTFNAALHFATDGSGVRTQTQVVDLDSDGLLDIVTSEGTILRQIACAP